MTLLAQIANTILSEALASPVGTQVLIQSPKPIPNMTHRAVQVLGRFKRLNSDFSCLQIKFCRHDPDNRLWIVKNTEQQQ